MYKTQFYIPDEMTSKRSWVLWRLEKDKNGRPTKIPYSALYHGKAASTKPDSWSSYTVARQEYINSNGYYNGVGYVLTKDGLVFIDIDHCFIGSQLSATARDILHTIGETFVEVSQSGTGLHIFTHGSIPRSFKNSSNGVEMYDSGRYCAITGDAACCASITNNQAGLDAVFDKYKTADPVIKHTVNRVALCNLSDSEIVEKCRGSRSGLFERLYAGDSSMYGSKSEADFALCLLLMFWTDGDANTVDRIFRSSGLMRDKWNREDYRRRTIERASAQCTETISEYKRRKREEGLTEYENRFFC